MRYPEKREKSRNGIVLSRPKIHLFYDDDDKIKLPFYNLFSFLKGNKTAERDQFTFAI